MDCKNCIFSEWNNEYQTGCSADRLSKFIEKGKATLKPIGVHTDDISTFYELQQFCNLYREDKWKKDKDSDKLLDLALKEIKPTFGVVVYDSKEKNNNLNDTLESIKNINYEKKLIKIVISSFSERGVQNLVSKVIEMQTEGFQCVMTMHTYNDIESLRDYECFSKLLNYSYFVKIPSGSEISKDVFNDVEISLNHKLEQKALFEDENSNISIVPFKIVNSEYLNYNSYDLMVQGIKDAIEKKSKP